MNITEAKPPPLNCEAVSGKEKDKLAFNTFINKLNKEIRFRKHLTDAPNLPI